MTKSQKLTKTLLVFFAYFTISMYGATFFKSMGISSDILNMFLGDLIFLSLIVYAYWSNIKSDYKDLSKNYSIRKIIFIAVIWAFIFLISKIIFGRIYDVSIGSELKNLNDAAMSGLYSRSAMYAIFKGMLFAPIAEQLLFRESVRDCTNNKWFFILISAFVVTMMNYIFIGNFSNVTIDIASFYFVSYFVPAIILGIVYIQNKSNILLLMLIYFTYSILPLIKMITGK